MKPDGRSLIGKVAALLRRVPAALKLTAVLLLLVALTASEHGLSEKRHGVGIVLAGSRYADGWYGANYDAALRACGGSDFELLTADNVGERKASMMAACDNLLRMGAEIIVLTGLEDPEKLRDYMKSHPHVQFSGFDLGLEAPNYHPVFFRMYQARYLAGMLAAEMSKSGILGYVAARPEVEVIRGVNAFALGARSVNPEAAVRLVWTGSWSDERLEENAVRALKRGGADVISYHQNEEFVPRAAERLNVDFIGMSMPLSGYSSHALSSVICDWDTFYRLLLRSFADQSYVPPLWPGIASGAVGLAEFSPRVPKAAAKRITEARHALERGELRVFSGEIADLSGAVHDFGSEGPEDPWLLHDMNYLVSGLETVNGN